MFSTPRPSAEAVGTWWMLREGESFPLEDIPTGKLSVAVASPMSMHKCAKRAQWIMEKERRKTKRDMKLKDGNMGGGYRVVGGKKWENEYNYISLNPCMKFSRIKKNYKNTRICAYIFNHTIFYYYVMVIYYNNKLFY